MKLLLDHNLPQRLRLHLPEHEVHAAGALGWNTLVDGELLTAAAEAGFDAMLTMDRGLPHQQNPRTLPLAVLILVAPNNRLPTLLTLLSSIREVLDSQPDPQFIKVRSDAAE